MTIQLGLLREDLEEPAGEKPARALRRVQVLEREVKRLEEILQDFLLFAGGHRREPRPTDLNGVVAEVLDFVTPAAHRAGVEVRRHLGEVPSLALERDRVKQALLNLVLNAEEAMRGRRGELLVQTSVQGGAVRLDVTDTGPGIQEDVLPRIFEVYFSTKRSGTGLGLPLVRRVMEEHGGQVEVFTEVGKGTRFTLWFPIPAAAAGAAREARPARQRRERARAKEGGR